MFKSIIADSGGIPVEVNTDTGENTALVVATRDHKTYTSKTVFFTNSTYGREMAQDASYGTIDWTIHDGTDTTEADSGNTDGIGGDTNKLKDSAQNFESTVLAGMSVHNTSDTSYTWVSAVASDTELSLLDDIMDDGEDFIVGPDWIFSEPTGTKWVENSTTQFHAGTKSLECDNAIVGDIMQLINVGGTDVTLSHFAAITMWVYVASDWLGGDSVSLYAHNDGALVGNKVYLEDYFAYATTNKWQYINVPLADMGLSVATIDAIRFENESREGAKSPQFWLDEIKLKYSGSAIDYEVIPDKGTWFYVKAFQTTFVDAYDPADADGTMPNLSYNKILDMTPTTGYIYKRYSAGETDPISEMRITNLMDLLSLPYSKISNYISDGTNTLITIENTYPPGMEYVLKSEDLDKLVFTIDDKFDDLLYFRICVQGYVEQRS